MSNRLFRYAPIRQRRDTLEPKQVGGERSDFSYSGSDGDLLDLADVMVEQAVGYMGMPLALAGPFIIDNHEYMVPLVTEEPSVVAASSFAAHLLGRHGGLSTQATEPIMTAQIFLEDLGEKGASSVNVIEEGRRLIRQALQPLLASMEERGGGWRGMDVRWIDPSQTLGVNLHINVQDSMGANLLNSVAEAICPTLEKLTGGRVLMAILSNRSWNRTASARFRIPITALSYPGFEGRETARRIVRAARVAREDPDRAVTHNKGIMNGITALALATGNDTRSIEAAAHAYAGRYGPYHGLSEYWIEEDAFNGSLELPLPFATTGGAVGLHPVSRWSLAVLENPDATGLSRIAAAVGLAQNLASLRALVSEGIQKSHMALHAKRLAFHAGARGNEVAAFAKIIRKEGIRGKDGAVVRFAEWNRR